jgi:hypothetical protein
MLNAKIVEERGFFKLAMRPEVTMPTQAHRGQTALI